MTSKYFSIEALESKYSDIYPHSLLEKYLKTKNYISNEKKKIKAIELIKIGNVTEMQNLIDTTGKNIVLDINSGLTSFRVPFETTVEDSKTISMQVIFPSKVGVEISNKESFDKIYTQFILTASLKIVSTPLKYLPTLEKIYFSGVTQSVHPTKGHIYMACIISFVLDVNEYDTIIVENITPEAVLSNFQLRFKYDKNFELNEVTPHVYLGINDSQEIINLDIIDPVEFENLIKRLLNKMELVAETTQRSHDGGIDVIAVSENPIIGGRFVIQCKRYKESVSVGAVRDLYGAMTSERASKGILITTSDFSNDGVKFAQGKPIELINRGKLIQLLNRHGFMPINK